MTHTTLWGDRDRRLPALSAEDRAAAELALTVFDQAPRGTSPKRIAELMGTAAAAMPKRETSQPEAELRLEVYQQALADIDSDVLKSAFLEAVKTLTFFPTVAEIRAIASRLPAPTRVWRSFQLRQLLKAEPPRVAEPTVEAEDLATVRASLDASARALPPPIPPASRPEPVIEDYLAIGLGETEARQAMADRARMLGRGRERPIGYAAALDQAA